MVDHIQVKTRAYHAVPAMPSVAWNTDDPQEQQQAQPPIPRSSYRHASSGDITHAPRVSVTSATSAIAAQPTEPSMPPISPSPSRQTSSMKSSNLPSGTPTPRSNSLATSIGSPGNPTKASKVKGASFFGFFTVKEPSARALLDYEEHVRKQAQTRNGRLTAVGMPGVSSAKLPATVPKVNSKWDGVPQAFKEKEREKEANKRHSTTSAGHSFRASLSAITHGGSDHSHSSSSTLDSEASRRNTGTGHSIFSSKSASQSSLGTRSGRENGSISIGSDSRDLPCRDNSQSWTSHSSTTLAGITSVTSDGSANRIRRTASGGGTSTDSEVFPPVPRLTESDSLRSVESTAAVPSRSLPLIAAPSRGAIVPTTHKDNTSNISSTSLPIAQADVSVKSSGADVLGPPATVRPKAKLQPPLIGGAGSLNDAAVSPSHSILRRDASRPGPARPPMSSYFTHSAVETAGIRQRPGLEMSTEGDPVAPWETEGAANGSGAGRGSPPVAQNGRGLLKRGRLAIFNK